MRKFILLIVLFLWAAVYSFAQVGVNNDGSSPNNSAMLDVKSTNRGMLPPRMTTSERNSIPSPAAGLLIFNTDCSDMQYFNGTGWIPMANHGNLATPGAVGGNASPCINSSGNTYSVGAVPNATGYHWTVPAGATITSGQGSATITVTFGTASGVICVAAYNECYRSLVSCLTITLTPLVPVGVIIAANVNPVCSGTQVTFSATPVNGGSSPTYQWQKNNINIPGATNSTYTYAPVNNDVISCRVTSNAVCVSGNPVISPGLTVIVFSSQPVSVSIIASANTICAGTVVNFTATPVNGGTLPAYQWRKGSNNISGATNATYSYTPLDGDVISCVLTSNTPCPSGNPATSNLVNMTVIPLLPVSVTIAASSNPSCAGSSVLFTATPVNGGLTPAYQWRKGGTNISGATNATYSYVPLNGDAISCVLTSSVICKTGNPATSNVVTMTINQPQLVSVVIGANATTVCSGTQVTFTATPVNGGAAPTYQWKKNSAVISGATNVTYSYAPVNNDAITCTMTSNAPCVSGSPATSPGISMTVISNSPVAITISASANPVCTGASVTFSSSITNGGTSPQYQWRVNGVNRSGATNGTMSYVPSNNDLVTCVLTSNALCATGSPAPSNSPTMVVNPYVTPDILIRVGSSYQCGSSSVPFVAVPVNGGTTPLYQWRLNGSIVPGATNATYTPASYNQVDCQMTSNAACISGSAVVSDFLQADGAVIIQNPVCYGEPIEMFCAALTGGCGLASSVYLWENSSGSWQSSEANPVINAGTAGYASDIFYLTVNYSPPVGGLSKGWACAVVQPLSSCVPCGSPFTINHVAGSVAPVAKTVSYGTINNIPGETSKCWITKNLGATQQATTVSDATEASAGWYWQFNRKQGYKHDRTTRTPNTTWVASITESSDWLTANDPCNLELGTAWRLPTYAEWYNVDNAGGWTTWNGPWGSDLKLHAAGYLFYGDGSLNYHGSYGYYWSSAQYVATNGWSLYFYSGLSYMNYSYGKANGFSARCIRDN